MLIGISFSSFGVSLSIKSNLGATPIGVCPAVFSPHFNISTGTGMGILLALFFLAQIIILRKEFRPVQFMQLAAAAVYSTIIDLSTKLFSRLPATAFWQRALYSASGILALAFGVFIMLKTDFLMLPQDAVVKAVSEKHGFEYGKIKIVLDSILTVIAAAGSFILHEKLEQVGVGTLIAAIFVGATISRLKGSESINRILERALGMA